MLEDLVRNILIVLHLQQQWLTSKGSNKHVIIFNNHSLIYLFFFLPFYYRILCKLRLVVFVSFHDPHSTCLALTLEILFLHMRHHIVALLYPSQRMSYRARFSAFDKTRHAIYIYHLLVS